MFPTSTTFGRVKNGPHQVQKTLVQFAVREARGTEMHMQEEFYKLDLLDTHLVNNQRGKIDGKLAASKIIWCATLVLGFFQHLVIKRH